MKGRFLLKPRARADFEEIFDYTAGRWGFVQAETYTRQLAKDMQALADNPSAGRDCEAVRPGYRKYTSGAHVVCYRLTEGGVDIVRILHERSDYERHIP